VGITKTDFDFIKIGPYIRHLGPLNKPTTNQRLYQQTANGEFEDITYKFWRKQMAQ
jgi:anaerobic ribonucleoside-triphosphate reductase activating protein